MNSTNQNKAISFTLLTGFWFMDTAGSVSVILPSQTDRKCPQQNFNLQVVNNTS